MAIIIFFYKYLMILSVFLELKFPEQFAKFRFVMQTIFSFFYVDLFAKFMVFMEKTNFDSMSYIEIISVFASENRLAIIMILAFAILNRLFVKRKEASFLFVAIFINIVLLMLGV